MSQLSTYLTLVTQKLAQSNLGFHTQPIRIQAINEAILKIADDYEIPELRVKPVPTGLITFAFGVVDIPMDLLRVVKIWDPALQSPSNEYEYLVNDLFDQEPPKANSRYWTIDFDPSTSTQRMFIVPSTDATKSLELRYIKNPVVLATSSDESGISYHWDNAIAYKAASILLNNERNASAGIMEESARQEIEKAYQAIRKVGGVKMGERLRSRFEKYPLLYNRQV